ALIDGLEVKNKELEAFSYSVSNDLRAPLRDVFAFSTTMQKEFSSQMVPEANDLLNRIITNAQRMERLLDDLLRLAMLERHPLSNEPVYVRGLVNEVLEELQREHSDRSIQVEVGDLPDCTGDPSLLRQVFVNLLSNAFKFTLK